MGWLWGIHSPAMGRLWGNTTGLWGICGAPPRAMGYLWGVYEPSHPGYGASMGHPHPQLWGIYEASPPRAMGHLWGSTAGQCGAPKTTVLFPQPSGNPTSNLQQWGTYGVRPQSMGCLRHL